MMFLAYIDLSYSFSPGESSKVKAEKVDAVVCQGNYQLKMLHSLTDNTPKSLLSHRCLNMS